MSIVYGAGTQNWSIAQNALGVMYFGNNDGLLSFDGNYWKLHEMPNKSIVRSLKIDTLGRIYVGAYNEFGYFEPDCDNKKLQYISLSSQLPDSLKSFGEIWRIVLNEEGIYFQSFSHIFLLTETGLTLLMKQQGLQYLTVVNDEVYINIEGIGLSRVGPGGVKLQEGGAFFADKLVKACFELDDRLFVGTTNSGIYRKENNKYIYWDVPISALVEDAQLYSLETVKDYLILGTISNGVFIVNKQGGIIQHLNMDKGIQNNSVLTVFPDNQDNLWLGLDNGIDYIHLSSPLSYINPRGKLGACYYSHLEGNNLYLGTNQGLYLTDWSKIKSNEFTVDKELFKNILNGQVWTLKTVGGKIVCGSNEGTFIIDNENVNQISGVDGGWQYHLWPGDNTKMLGSTFNGLILFEYKNGSWHFVKRLEGFNESCPEFEIDKDENIWLCHRYKGLFKIKLNKSLDQINEIEFYDTAQGLPSNYLNSLFKLSNEVYVSGGQSIYRFNYQKRVFEKEPELTAVFGNKKVNKVYADDESNYWYFHDRGVGVLRTNFDGSFTSHSLPYFDAERLFLKNFEHLLPIDNTNIIVSTRDGYIHFSPNLTVNVNKEFSIFIRQVKANGKQLYFNSEKCLKRNTVEALSGKEVFLGKLSYRNNSIQVKIGTDYYENISSVRYQYWLEGDQPGWTEWSPEAFIVLNNLHEGKYLLHLRAKNEFDKLSGELVYSFEVFPPWYRSTFAYGFYAIVIISGIFFSVVFIVRKIEKEKGYLRERQEEELKQKQKQFEKESMLAEQEIVRLRNEKLRIEIERNKADLENQSKELASIVMQANYKNELLDRIKHKLAKVSQKMIHTESKKEVENVVGAIEKELDQKEDWKRFEVHFDQVHEDFIKRIRIKYPNLTPKDVKLAAYLRMNLSTKEIAPLLNISLRGIETGRYRLRKKLGLDRSANLTDFLLNI